jgi:hypothetical protein
MGQMMGNLGNKNVMDPSQANWGDLDSSEKGARVGGAAMRGLGQGFSNYEKQNQALRTPNGGASVNGNFDAPAVDPSYFSPQQPNGLQSGGMGLPPRRNNMFFGQ